MLPFKLKNKHLIRFVALLLVILLLAIFLPALKSPLLSILKGPFGLLTLILRQTQGLIFYRHTLTENGRLKKEIDLLKYKLNALEEVQAENKRLQDLLLFKQKSSFKVISARVIGRSTDSWSSMVIIDKGRFNGIKKPMVVINYLGLVGRVEEALESSSKLMLINDPNFAVSAMNKRSRQEGLASGTLGASLMMKYLPLDSDIRIRDEIITSGLSPLYPKGLLIGTVIDLGEEFSGLSRYALIKPVVDLSSIEEVLIIVE